jgi:hypothetical protein
VFVDSKIPPGLIMRLRQATAPAMAQAGPRGRGAMPADSKALDFTSHIPNAQGWQREPHDGLCSSVAAGLDEKRSLRM